MNCIDFITLRAIEVIRGDLMEMQEIGKIVQYHRKRVRLSRERLSKLSGVSASAIYGIEKGKQSVRMNTLMRILRALNISIHIDGPLVREYRERINLAGS